MPSPQEILLQLGRAANELWILALVWHVLLAGALAALASGWKPARGAAAVMLAAPLASASVAGFASGSPFNGVVLAAGAIALLVVGAQRGKLGVPPAWAAWLGGAAVAFAASYPHFLEGSVWRYLYAAPVGVLPCPTLSLVLGLGLLANGLGSRGWQLIAGGLGAFYALFGMLRLGVWLDAGLLAAALGMLVLAIMPAPAPVRRRRGAAASRA